MTQEEREKEKELLLNVLKDGLPYGLQLQITDVDEFTFNGELCVLSKNWCRLNIADPVKREKVKNQTIPLNYIYIKPYLRPMVSMTEEEFESLKEYSGLKYEQLDLASYQNGTYKCLDFYLSEVPSYVVILVFDWLNAYHFDYRGLIERGLAIAVTEENNPYKE